MTATDSTAPGGSGPPEPLEFLVGSWNRYVALAALAEAPTTRRTLRESTGVSRPTLSRILSDLVDRGWIVRRNDVYEATPAGRVVVDEVAGLVDDLAAAEALDDALDWLRTDRLGFPLAELADAAVHSPSKRDQTGGIRRVGEFVSGSTSVRVVATGVTYEVVDGLCGAALADELRLECVLGGDAVAGIREQSDLAAAFRELIDRDRCAAFRYPGEGDPLDLTLLDDRVMFCGHDERGAPAGVLISENETVRRWAAVRFEELRSAGAPLGADAFTA